MKAVVDSLGLGDRPNTSYIKALGALVGIDAAS
jgi:hypothetical protein